MRTFLLSIEVHLEKPMELVSEEGMEKAKLAGFVQELGVRAEDEAAAKALVRAEVEAADLGPAQKTELIFIEIDEIESDGAQLSEAERPEATSRSRPGEAPPVEPGVYRRSGRSFYSEE
jgi:hypothetical protein